jgi:hypothetical protein
LHIVATDSFQDSQFGLGPSKLHPHYVDGQSNESQPSDRLSPRDRAMHALAAQNIPVGDESTKLKCDGYRFSPAEIKMSSPFSG